MATLMEKDGGASGALACDSGLTSITFRARTAAERDPARRQLDARFFGGRIYAIVVVTRYPVVVPRAPSEFDAIRRRGIAALGPPSWAGKSEGVAPQVEWRRGPGLYWTRRIGTTGRDGVGIDEVSVGSLDCRYAPSDSEECTDLPPEKSRP